MFYCNTCADEKKWPKATFKSYGKCELCNEVDNCNNIPSRELPESEDRRNEDQFERPTKESP